MTGASIREYSEAVRRRYLQAPKKKKTKILDEFIKVTGYHRKAIIRLLHRVNQPNAKWCYYHPVWCSQGSDKRAGSRPGLV